MLLYREGLNGWRDCKEVTCRSDVEEPAAEPASCLRTSELYSPPASSKASCVPTACTAPSAITLPQHPRQGVAHKTVSSGKQQA